MSKESVNIHVNNYCRLRDKQYAVYTEYAKKYGLTTKELFILDIIYFAQSGCTQAGICERLSATKQTVSAAIKKFWKLGYLSFEESKTDRRIRLVRFTAAGTHHPPCRAGGKRRHGGIERRTASGTGPFNRPFFGTNASEISIHQ